MLPPATVCSVWAECFIRFPLSNEKHELGFSEPHRVVLVIRDCRAARKRLCGDVANVLFDAADGRHDSGILSPPCSNLLSRPRAIESGALSRPVLPESCLRHHGGAWVLSEY